ncbi:GNAT family N-acetyltransferase [Reinekea marinisedimentorum]|uniref:Acetyltransferase (GNAT) family protein n=1 Tax=Reinekea marinisedimentorum TaxID=230495 RepID=A0A4R3HR08_9GAMM|nr:GNAT family N-acetyltransferase [Reinekea marinisedimentorum]TCS34783.1 acetyltransferase (GNAT) family protein [Reinekea marinisedimentorum]
MYQLKAEIPSVEEYIEIRLAAGLSRKSEEAAAIALPNSIYGVTVYSGNEKVGIARIIGDGGCFFEVTDMAVLPEHQNKGVGRIIMEHLVAWLKANAPKTAYVSLIADHGTPEFYAKFGFKKAEMPKSSGMSMRIL